MLSIHSKPPDIIFSGNPAWFSIEQSEEGPRQIRAILKDGATEVGSLYSYASSQNIAHFELSELIDSVVKSLVSHSTPGEISPGSIVHKITNHTIKTLSVTFTDNTSEVSCSFTALKGVITPDLFSLIGYGYEKQSTSQYLSDNPVLSVRPSDIYVHDKNQPERLYLYFKEAVSLSLMVSVFTNRETYHQTLASINAPANSLYSIDASYNSIVSPILVQPDEICSDYNLQLYNGFVPFTRRYNYHVDLSGRSKGCFFFRNSLGGYDTLSPTGILSVRSSRAHDATPVAETPFFKKHKTHISDIKPTVLYTQDTGMLPASYAHSIQQLLYSPQVYWVPKGGGLREITINESNLTLSDSPGELVSAKIPYFFNPQIKAEQQ